MTIRGDPGYIQEEDFVYFWDGSRPKDENDDRLFQSGSLVINDSQLLAKIQFRFPDDIDTQSGLYTSNRTAEKANGNLFSGIYIVVKVDSMFEHGSFTQKLDLVKVFNDPRALLKTAKDSELTRQQSQTEANEANQPLGLEEQISQQEIATSQYGVDDTDQVQADFTRQENKATEAEEALYNTRQAQQTETTTDVAAREQISEGQKISSDIEAAQEAELARNTLFGI
jgi:hypothetical protein